MVKKRFQIFLTSNKEEVVCDFTVSSPGVTGAENDIILLDSEGKAIAVIELQPGYDRREVDL